MIAALLEAAYRLLRPNPQLCLHCGREERSPGAGGLIAPLRSPAARTALSELCAACRACIPWIMTVACSVCGRPERCGDCLRRTARHFAASRAAVRYDDVMKEWLAAYKYQGAERLAPLMAAMLAAALERYSQAPAQSFDLIAAVPLSESRLASRGFNQAEGMASILAGWYGIPYANLLVRTRDTEKQSRKGRGARIRDMQGLFQPAIPAVHPSIQNSANPRILLVDDIYTTGSTMNECARAIRQALPAADIFGLAWARA